MKPLYQYVYATLLPTGYVKVGAASKTTRAVAAGTYHVGSLRVLGVWHVLDARRAEQIAHRALWWAHVERELFEGDPSLIIETINGAIGTVPTITTYEHRPPSRRGRHTAAMRAKMLKRT